MPTEPHNDDMQDLVRRLADRKKVRSEATLQADVRQLLLTGGLNLAEHDLSVDMETQVGDRRRIDIEVGYTVIETKKDLRSKTVLQAAVSQLDGYVTTRTEQTGQRYVGILTDGADWQAYNLQAGTLILATRFQLKPRTPVTDLLFWLEGVLATCTDIQPTPAEITKRLGADSPSYELDRTVLKALYQEHKDEPTVQMKRQLWARLLRSAQGAQFTDDDDLFIEHTLLVNSAEIIAHLVLGVPVDDLQPATLLLGHRFDQAQLYGVVEADFFDWVIEMPGGESLVRTMARRLARFDWSHVEHDVLKVLYESVISAETRKTLGEYYTPDWLAEQVVDDVVTDPLAQRALDPSCGSGTFLFHAARRYLQAAETAGVPLRTALEGLTDHVAGIDLHPVAVSLARVTYLLAIGRERLTSDERGPIRVPVYLGDSLQWKQRLDLIDQGHLVIKTRDDGMLWESELRFPEHLLEDASRFDQLVNDLADLATRKRAKGTVPSLNSLFNRLAVAPGDQPAISANFKILCQLVDEERNHIWSYYIRNLARPMWLSRAENRVEVLIGNPPWLSYRHMSKDMQETFKEMSQERGLWKGREVATHQDLSGLFIARAIQQYLADGGHFGFVVPNAVLDRGYFSGFRRGHYASQSEPIDVAFGQSWDLRRLRPHIFPRGSAVVFGRRAPSGKAAALPKATLRWTGRLPRKAQDWPTVGANVTRESAELRQSGEDLVESPYAPRFSQGASIVPRMLFFVDPQEVGPLGLGGGRVPIRSTRSTLEKKPWKDLPDLEGVVEKEFVRPTMLGESVLPFRLLPPRSAVLPLEGATLLDGEHPHMARYPDLAEWWSTVEETWERHKSGNLTLRGQIDFRHKLAGQLPGTPLRVVYGKAGMHVAASLVENPNAVIDHKLYWGTVTTREEGMYLCAILNTPAVTELVRPLMSYGKDERDIDKAVWQLPIPMFDASIPSHARLAELGAAEAERIADLPLDESKSFIRLRQVVREELALSPHAEELDLLVHGLLD